MELLIKQYMKDMDNFKSVCEIIFGFYATDVTFKEREETAIRQLEDLGETDVLEQFKKGTFCMN